MNLCIVANGNFFSTYGGGQVYVKNLVDELIRQKDEQGITLYIISFDPSFAETPKRKDYHGVNLYEMNPRGDISNLLSSINPDIVHAHGEKAKVVKCCHELGIKCVITAHHGGICCPAGSLLNTKDEICHEAANSQRCLPCYLRNIRTGKFWYPIVKHVPTKQYLQIGKAFNKLPFIPFLSPIGEAMLSIQNKLVQWNTIHTLANHIIAPSDAIADSMILNGCDKNKITVIPHGIPIHKIENKPTAIGPESIAFYYVGRICYVKGIHVMLKAFSMIDNPNIELHIIGGSGNKSEQRYQNRLIRQYSNNKKIIWHGKLGPEQVEKMVEKYHCLIHPAIYLEVFGLNIAEALAQHKYVIATRCGGSEMQIRSTDDGVIVPPNDCMSLVHAMNAYINLPQNSNTTVGYISENVFDIFEVYRLALS